MKFVLEVECNNSAFGESPAEKRDELRRIIAEAANALRFIPGEEIRWNVLRDINGNRVGHWFLGDKESVRGGYELYFGRKPGARS